jgi:hypothetical protein
MSERILFIDALLVQRIYHPRCGLTTAYKYIRNVKQELGIDHNKKLSLVKFIRCMGLDPQETIEHLQMNWDDYKKDFK